MAIPAPGNQPQRSTVQKASPDVIDLLATAPSGVPFSARVKNLALSSSLEKKIIQQEDRPLSGRHALPKNCHHLTIADEKELATEMLLLRHQFTELVFNSRKFRQAAISIIQNIYLFQNRKIFFGTLNSVSSEQERQQALHLFSTNRPWGSITFAKTFQHLILARVWNRIISNATDDDLKGRMFIELQAIVEKLNTIRNIYILLTAGLVKKLAGRINDIYKESITYEDAVQIGSIGIARAAYRYHQSSGIRFSTFAAHWVFKEIQRQSLNGRLIRLSTNTVERYSRAAQNGETADINKFLSQIELATTSGENHLPEDACTSFHESASDFSRLTKDFESQELYEKLLQAIETLLSDKCADVIKRRYGFPPYQNQEQSVIAISRIFGVTRGSIYQLEQSALKKLHHHLQAANIY